MHGANVSIMAHDAYISIGSNIGNLRDHCCRAIRALGAERRIDVVERSAFYRTAPVDFAAQDWFLNAALKLRTDLHPDQLLDRMQKIQREMGRKENPVRFGPRIIDLDLIFYDDLVLQAPGLIVPHPRMHKRRFVLQPICDIDPTIVHPLLGVSVQYLLNQLVMGNQEIEKCSFGC
jgi:2-amino-4-hydroxy-6-hydroxymethyldihydropteridine diphosphokinase